MLSKKQLEDVCLYSVGDSTCCRYLKDDDTEPGKYFCCKLSLSEKSTIDARIKEFIKTQNKKGLDPFASGVPLGNNCKGYPSGLRHIEQGYDK